MTTNFDFPTSAELIAVAQDKLPDLTREDPVFSIFPITSHDAPVIKWEQMDNYTGLQQVRGANGEPPRVKRIGLKQYQIDPGYYGEFERVDELELTARRTFGTWNQPIQISDIVMQIQDHLLNRFLDRIKTTAWTLLTTGTFSITGPTGVTLHTDSYTTQTFSASPSWATVGSATPLNDFRQVQLLSRGHSVNFGPAATAYMNRKTYNNLINNSNAADLYGRRTSGLSIVNNVNDLNRLLMGDGLPGIEIYDNGYLRESDGAFVPFIPDNKVVVIGQRPNNTSLGEYRMVRNATNPDMAPGLYMNVVDSMNSQKPPRTIEVHSGHNGGPVLFYPSAIVLMSV